MDQDKRVSLTPTVARQTQKTEFGDVLRNTIQNVGTVGNSLLGALPGGGLISTAVSNVAALTQRHGGVAQSVSAVVGLPGTGGVTTVDGATGQTMATSPQGVPSELTGMIGQMRAEADRSTMMQMQMQQESREYNTISNVLKVRHDSAKAAINNIR